MNGTIKPAAHPVSGLRLHPHAALNHQGTVVFNGLGGDFPQVHLPEQAVLLRVFCPGIEQCPLYMGLNPGQLRQEHCQNQ